MSPAAKTSPAGGPCTSKVPEVFRDFGFAAETRLQSRWTEVENLRIHSRSSAYASGAPFVLIHGLVISSLYMIPLGEYLAVDHQVHAIDLPGSGRSDANLDLLSIPRLANAVVQWLAAAKVGRCHLVANSLGCQIAAHVAVTAPERVASLTLIGATIDPEARSLISQILRLIRDALHEPLRLWTNWIVDFCRMGLPRAIRLTRQMFLDRIEDQLPLIAVPTLVMRGERDPTMPERWARRVTELLRHGRMRTIPGAAHCAHYSHPEVVADAIARHACESAGSTPAAPA